MEGWQTKGRQRRLTYLHRLIRRDLIKGMVQSSLNNRTDIPLNQILLSVSTPVLLRSSPANTHMDVPTGYRDSPHCRTTTPGESRDLRPVSVQCEDRGSCVRLHGALNTLQEVVKRSTGLIPYLEWVSSFPPFFPVSVCKRKNTNSLSCRQQYVLTWVKGTISGPGTAPKEKCRNRTEGMV